MMNVNEYEMLIELLKEASGTFEEFELNIGTCEGYRYALKDELLGYALMLEESLTGKSPETTQ